MDDLIERLERKFHGPDRLTMANRYDAATALRAYEEREKELVEALEFYADRATYEGTWDAQFRMTIYPINNDVGKRARAILLKHKAPA